MRRVFTDISGRLFVEAEPNRVRHIRLDGTLAAFASHTLSHYLRTGSLKFAYNEDHVIVEEDEL